MTLELLARSEAVRPIAQIRPIDLKVAHGKAQFHQRWCYP